MFFPFRMAKREAQAHHIFKWAFSSIYYIQCEVPLLCDFPHLKEQEHAVEF